MKKLLTIIAISVSITMFAQVTPINPKLAKAVQCTAATKKGDRCKKMTKNTNKLCSIHQTKSK